MPGTQQESVQQELSGLEEAAMEFWMNTSAEAQLGRRDLDVAAAAMMERAEMALACRIRSDERIRTE